MGNPFVDFEILAGAGAPTRSFKAGDIIFRQADPAEELYVQHFRRNGADRPQSAERNGGCGNRRDRRSGRREAVSLLGYCPVFVS